MIDLIITNQLHRKIVVYKNQPRLISMRALKRKEILLAREQGISKYYLPSLNEAESENFFKEFDKFWDSLIKPFDSRHFFWRNVVSSKMQEWERSFTYLALVLFTIAQKAVKRPQSIVILCSCLEEECVCEEWGTKMGWNVYITPKLPLPFWLRQFFQEIRNAKNFLHMFAVCLYKKWVSPKYKHSAGSGKGQLLISSLFYDSCFKNGLYLDPFFGNLHNTIQENGKSAKYFAGHLGNYRSSTKKLMENGLDYIILPYSLIRWAELILLGLKVFVRRVRLSGRVFCGCDFSKLIMWDARRFDYLFNLDSEIFFRAMANLCKVEQFERLIQLYEGNVFERGCIQAFQKYNNGKVVGYSHAVVYPLNLKIRLTENEKKQKPEPDILISTGLETKHLMVRIGNRDSSNVISGCSLRNIPDLDDIETLEDGIKPSETIRSDILVALDGVWSCVTVLDWLMEQKEVLKKYRIILRGHPNVPVKELLAQCIHELPDNFQFSNNDLKADIENSFCVIYRQSSVGLQALMNGIPVIHLNVDSPLNSDPIVNLSDSKWIVTSGNDFYEAIKEIRTVNSSEKKFAMKKAKEYSKQYFTVSDQATLSYFYR
jgi:hypothetical protein